MGFGLLLLGYMFAFVATAGLGPYLFGGLLVGSAIMFFGLKELKKYSPVFIYAFIGDLALFACGIASLSTWIASTFISLDTTVISTVVSCAKIAICLFFDISMLYGIADLSRRVDYPDTRNKAYRNMVFVGIFNVFQIFMMLPIEFVKNESGFLMTLLMILQIVYTAINALLIFKCYAMICPVGQEDMPRKKSRFAFINKFREIRDAKDEKAMEEMKSYYEEKLKKKNQKKNSQNHSKKKKKKK